MIRNISIGLMFVLIYFSAALADDVAKSISWRVPDNVTEVRIQSWAADGTLKIDRSISVEPGQKFKVDAIHD